MRIDHRVVTYEGERLGDLVSCGPRFRFFTTLEALAPLDGRAFGGQAEVIAAALPLLMGARCAGRTGASSAPRQDDLDRRPAVAVDAVMRPDRHRAKTVRDLDAA